MILIDWLLIRARAAQVAWAETSFAKRSQFLQLLNDFILANQESMSKIAARDSGESSFLLLLLLLLFHCNHSIAFMVFNNRNKHQASNLSRANPEYIRKT